jgi:hypothetical protein
MKNLRIVMMLVLLILVSGLNKALAQGTAVITENEAIVNYAPIRDDKEHFSPPPNPLVSLHQDLKTQLKLFPNPSRGNFSLETNLRGTHNLLIFDLLGNIHLRKTVYIEDNGLVKVDLTNSAKGLYLVNLGELTLKFQKT